MRGKRRTAKKRGGTNGSFQKTETAKIEAALRATFRPVGAAVVACRDRKQAEVKRPELTAWSNGRPDCAQPESGYERIWL